MWICEFNGAGLGLRILGEGVVRAAGGVLRGGVFGYLDIELQKWGDVSVRVKCNL